MRFGTPTRGTMGVCLSALAIACLSRSVDAATIVVPAGGDLQAAINAALPGDVITLAAGATYVGNFVLSNKGAITQPIVIRTAGNDATLPPANVRMTPSYASLLAKIKSPNTASAIRTAAGANHWTLMLLEFQANVQGYNEIISLGAGDSSQTSLAQVPHHLILDRLYVHGDPVFGQKRGVALNSSDTTVINSYISDCKAVGQDSQALGGYNGPGNFLIENNYLEGAAENVLFGGADPTIPGLVTTNITFRGNYLTKPLAWRDPLVPQPQSVTAAASAGAGSLPVGTYYYKVVARQTTYTGLKANSVASAEVSATLAATGAIQLAWAPVPGATDYIIFGRTAGTENMYWKSTTASFLETGAAGTSGAPASTTKWSVKNLFEFKNVQDAVVEGNIFDTLWVADQAGFAIQLTPRNQSGTAPQAVVQRVTFRNNIVRHTAGGVNILGVDDEHPSQLTNHITIQNNVFDDLTKATWGSGAWVFQMGAGAANTTMDHNTIVTTDSIVALYGGSATSPTLMPAWVYTNNMSVHNAYGIFGNNFTYGTGGITPYAPDAVVTANVLAGGSASRYPTGNFFPTALNWQAGFANYTAGDYHLLPTSPFKGAGTDGKDLGADIDAVRSATANAESGDNRYPGGTSQVQITTTSLPDGTFLRAYLQGMACTGGSGACAWSLQGGALPPGVTIDGTGVIAGTPTSAETDSITIQAWDPTWPSNSATKTLSLTINPPPFTMTIPATASGQVGRALSLLGNATGAMGSVAWTIASGNLPAGIALDPASGAITGTPTAWGTFAAIVQAQDTWGLNRIVAVPVTFTIAPTDLSITTTNGPAGMYHVMYSLPLTAAGGTGTVSWSLVSGTIPDGLIFDAAGMLSGLPNSVGAFSLTVQAVDTNWPANTATGTVAFVINPPSFSIAMPPPPAGQVGATYLLIPTVTGNIGPVAWTVTGGSLPAGLHLDPASGAITGLPTMWGTTTAVVSATDTWDSSRVQSGSVSITIAPTAIAVATTSLPGGTAGTAYLTTVASTGGTGTTTWSISGGALPAGVALTSTGQISGTPTIAGTYAITVRAIDVNWPANTATATLAMVVAAPPPSPAPPSSSVLPSPWQRQDIGAVGVAGSAQFANGGFTTSASGADVWGTADAFGFVYRPWTGDGVIVARITGVSPTNVWSKSGVMFRESLAAGSAQAFALVSAARGVAFQRRTATNAASASTSGSQSPAPRWIRLARVGNTFTAAESVDGATWTVMGTDTIPMSAQIYVGLAATSHDNTATTTATLDSVNVTVPSASILADEFNGGSLDTTKWTVGVMSGGSDGTVSVGVAAGALQIGPLRQVCQGTCYNGVYTAAAYDLTGASTAVQAVIAPATSHAESMLTVLADGQNHYRVWSEAGTLSFEKKIAGTKTELKSVPYDPINQAFWRIRHDAASDTIVFETAAAVNGIAGTWKAQTTVARQVNVTGMRVELKAGTYQNETTAPGAVTFDHLLVTK